MPVAKLKATNVTDLLKAEEGNDSLDTFINQAIAKEPLLSFSRNGDSSVQWIQLLQAIDQQELPGWPLLTPLKVQMQKCDKCSREFCSIINHRRHMRVHHRLKNLDKDSTKNRNLLEAFWDKLSVDEAKEIVSFKNAALEEVPGSSIVKSLTAVIRKPGFSSLPQICLRAGSALLDIVQARPSRFPMTSQELFSILDDASEKTFLSGTAVSMQKYLFDGEAGKIGLETRNLIACTSFLVEHLLVKAWLADKDAEALRCQKLLVEEEEAAQRRQAELLERKRQKKLRQKEQKAKEERDEEKMDDKESTDDTLESVPQPESTSSLGTSDSDAQNADSLPDHVPSSLEPCSFSNSEDDADYEVKTGSGNGYCDSRTGQNVERPMVQGIGHRRMVVTRRRVPPKAQGLLNGFHASQNSQAPKFGGMQKRGLNRDLRGAPSVNGNKVWNRKPKPENNWEIVKTRLLKEAINQPERTKNHEVRIGSISVTLGNCNQQEGKSPAEARDDCMVEHQMPKMNNVPEKPKFDSIQCGLNKSTVKFWRPVSWHGNKDAAPVQNGSTSRDSEADVNSGQAGDHTLCNESSLRPCSVDDSSTGLENTSPMEDSTCGGALEFNVHTARAFLSERWKEANAAEHVTLVLSPDSESSRYPKVQGDCQVAVFQSSDFHKRSVFGNAENRLVNTPSAFGLSTAGAAKSPKLRIKPKIGAKIENIPKQKIDT